MDKATLSLVGAPGFIVGLLALSARSPHRLGIENELQMPVPDPEGFCSIPASPSKIMAGMPFLVDMRKCQEDHAAQDFYEPEKRLRRKKLIVAGQSRLPMPK